LKPDSSKAKSRDKPLKVDEAQDYPLYRAWKMFLTEVVPSDYTEDNGIYDILLDLKIQVCFGSGGYNHYCRR
jgi:hypothetical protein